MTHLVHRWHDAVVAGIVGSYVDPVYIEIGVAHCECFKTVLPHTGVAHAVDPDRAALTHVPPGSHERIITAWNMTSNTFFKRYSGSPHVVFIDGKHTYAQAKRDFENAAEILRPDGTIILHDVWPDSVADTRVGACGDVYRLAQSLVADTEWRTFLFGRFPGLLICQRLADNPPWQWKPSGA